MPSSLSKLPTLKEKRAAKVEKELRKLRDAMIVYYNHLEKKQVKEGVMTEGGSGARPFELQQPLLVQKIEALKSLYGAIFKKDLIKSDKGQSLTDGKGAELGQDGIKAVLEGLKQIMTAEGDTNAERFRKNLDTLKQRRGGKGTYSAKSEGIFWGTLNAVLKIIGVYLVQGEGVTSKIEKAAGVTPPKKETSRAHHYRLFGRGREIRPVWGVLVSVEEFELNKEPQPPSKTPSRRSSGSDR
jgi:hypothetical protein